MVAKMMNWWLHTCAFCQIMHRVMSALFSLFVIGLSVYGSYQIIDWWRDDSPIHPSNIHRSFNTGFFIASFTGQEKAPRTTALETMPVTIF